MLLALGSTSLLAVTLALPPQDLVTVKGSRRPLRGTVTANTSKQVVFNPYFSTHPEMKWGVQVLDPAKVKKVVPDVPPHEEFWMRLEKAKGSADKLCELAEFKTNLKQQRLVALEWALRADPRHEAALKAYGTTKAKAFLSGDPVANSQLREDLDAFLKIEDQATLADRAEEIIQKHDLDWSKTYFARAWRSHRQPRGLTTDRPLTLQGNVVKGVYTLFVPESYDPFTPAPLLLGLHGGGRGGKEGKKVVGNGTSAMGFFQHLAAARGYIVVCPTAIEAPWSAHPNDAWIRALLDEVEALLHVDKHRVYLSGHSMGGIGSWHFGPKYCERWAAFAPMAGAGSNGLKKLRDTRTFVYIYHGGDDNVVPPHDSRSAAKRLLDGGNDFVYTELPDTGHGFPESVRKEMFYFFARKRLAINKRIQVRPHSSFLQKESKEEIRFFGRLIPKSSGSDPSQTKHLLRTLAEGGGAGEKAAAELAQQKDPKLVPKVIKLLHRKQTPADARALSARVLGQLGEPKALPALAAATLESKPDMAIVHEAVHAIARIKDPKQGNMILDAVTNLCAFFETRILGTKMHYSDWDSILPEMTFALEQLQTHKLVPPDIASRLDETVVKRVLLSRITVHHSARAGQDPSRAREPLLRITRDLLANSKDEVARKALEALKRLPR